MNYLQSNAMRILTILLFAIVSLAMVAASIPKLEAFNAELSPDNRSAIRLTWSVTGDDDVATYILLRQSADQSVRKQIHETEARVGSETRKQYTFDDNTLYKEDNSGQQVTYFLQIKMKGSGQIIEPINNQAKLTYTSTTVRRTWGSIKAMFQ